MPKLTLEKDGEEKCVESNDISDYLPYFMDVTESVRNYAKIHLNETPERRAECLTELKERLSQEEDLNSRTEELFLLNFLRSRKYNVGRAFNMIKNYYSFLEGHRHIFCKDYPVAPLQMAESNILSFLPYRDQQNRAILVIRAGHRHIFCKDYPVAPLQMAESNILSFLSYRDQQNRAILVIRAEAWDPRTISTDQAVYGGTILLKTFIEIPVNQIMGFVAILDCKNLSFKQIVSIVPRYAFFVAQGLQYCCPCKVQIIHIVNVPEIFRLAWKLVKHVISDKIKNRIIFHKGHGYESLHQHVPKVILPMELGGDQGPLRNESWIKNIEKIQMDYDEEMKHGYRNWNKKKTTNSIDKPSYTVTVHSQSSNTVAEHCQSSNAVAEHSQSSNGEGSS